MKDVRDGGNVDESRFLSYNQRRCLGRWLRALAALCLALTMAGGFTIVAGGIASGASAHALAPNQSCYVLSAKAADQWFCLTADAGVSQVQLTWDPSTPVNSVTVYQGDAEGNGQPAKICNVTDSSAVVPELTTGTTYYFWLVVGGTIMSNIVSATPSDQLTVPGTPAGLAATAGDHKATLRWKAPTSGGAPISGYDVSYATSADFTGASVVHGGKRTGLVVPKLVNGTTYYFKVSAVNLRGNGQAACEVSAVPV